MPSETVRNYVAGPELMDVTRFPDLVLHGACRGGAISGDLMMHDQTRPVVMDMVRSAGMIFAAGCLSRGERGMTGFPVPAGTMARIHLSLPNPAMPPRV